MITPELLAYIRKEFATGRTREEIKKELSRVGGWNESDLNEAFRAVIPMQNFATPIVNSVASAPNTSEARQSTFVPNSIPKPAPVTTSPKSNSVFSSDNFSIKDKTGSSSRILPVLIFLLLVGLGVFIWYFRPQIASVWNTGVEGVKSLVGPYLGLKVSSRTSTPMPIANNVKDCGMTNSPDLENKLTYENNAVLNCLGDSALRCEEAEAALKDSLFPSVFKVVKGSPGQEGCSFQLSYADDTTLVDVTGRKLAGQYIMCPLNIVKGVDDTKPNPSFEPADISDLAKYASQIYFYGILGVFVENNVEKDKILGLGCSGLYIDSVVASYNRAQSNGSLQQ